MLGALRRGLRLRGGKGVCALLERVEMYLGSFRRSKITVSLRCLRSLHRSHIRHHQLRERALRLGGLIGFTTQTFLLTRDLVLTCRHLARELVALLLQRGQQLARGLQLRREADLAAGERMLQRSAERTRLAGLQVVTMLVEARGLLRLLDHAALLLAGLRDALVFGVLRSQLFARGLQRSIERLGIRFAFVESLLNRLRLGLHAACGFELLKDLAPLTNGDALRGKRVRELCIGSMFLEPSLQRGAGFAVGDEVLLGLLALRLRGLLILLPLSEGRAAFVELRLVLLALRRVLRGLAPDRLALGARVASLSDSGLRLLERVGGFFLLFRDQREGIAEFRDVLLRVGLLALPLLPLLVLGKLLRSVLVLSEQARDGLLGFGELLLKVRTRFIIQHRHCAEAGLEAHDHFVLRLVRLVGEHGEITVNLGAGDLLQQFGALVWLRLQERRELSLRQ